jgi:DnaJ-class molecular chaperone
MKRKGADLFTVLKVTLATALCGGQFSLTHLDDRVLIMTNPTGAVVKPGTRAPQRPNDACVRVCVCACACAPSGL